METYTDEILADIKAARMEIRDGNRTLGFVEYLRDMVNLFWAEKYDKWEGKTKKVEAEMGKFINLANTYLEKLENEEFHADN